MRKGRSPGWKDRSGRDGAKMAGKEGIVSHDDAFNFLVYCDAAKITSLGSTVQGSSFRCKT